MGRLFSLWVNGVRIHYQSDLHLEFFREDIFTYALPSKDVDVIVLAGDIGLTKPRYFNWVLKQTDGIPTIMVLGNHESYGTSIQRAQRKWKQAMLNSHVQVLSDGEAAVINGVRFIGATLWTDFELLGKSAQRLSMDSAASRMNDYKKIKFEVGGAYRRFTPDSARLLHHSARGAIERELAKPHSGPTVVVSHHAPCPHSFCSDFRQDVLAPAYGSDLTWMMDKYRPQAWIHGHLHSSTNALIGNTRLLANPRGYAPDEINPDFNPCVLLTL